MLLYMKELVAAQLVSEQTADRFSFRHALTRQAVYTELLTGERRALHRSLAIAIEQQVTLTAVLDAWVEDLAYHFYEGEVWAKAVEYGQRAGERALLLYAPRAAIEHLTRTLNALLRSGRVHQRQYCAHGDKLMPPLARLNRLVEIMSRCFRLPETMRIA